MYDKKSVCCSQCGRFIGEIDEDAIVILPKCGQCVNPMPEGDDKVQYIVSKMINSENRNKIVVTN